MLKRFFTVTVFILGFLFIFAAAAIAMTPASELRATPPHWQKSPINVYIPKDPYAESLKRAFSKWQSLSSNKIKFNYVAKGPAYIDVVFTEKESGSESPIASYNIQTSGNKITKAEIRIATKGKDIKKYSRNYIYTTMLHEVGHALGMPHNDRKKSSIMYSQITETQQILNIDTVKFYHVNGWSWKDRRINH